MNTPKPSKLYLVEVSYSFNGPRQVVLHEATSITYARAAALRAGAYNTHAVSSELIPGKPVVVPRSMN